MSFRGRGRRGGMRRTMALTPIVTVKKQRAEVVTYAGLNANNVYTLYTGVAPGILETTSTVHTGKKVFSVDLSVNFISSSGGISGVFNWMLYKLRDGQSTNGEFAALDAASWSNIGLSNARNQVIKSYMGLVGTQDAGALRANVHISIPKIYQRVRQEDKLLLCFNSDIGGPLHIGSRFKTYT